MPSPALARSDDSDGEPGSPRARAAVAALFRPPAGRPVPHQSGPSVVVQAGHEHGESGTVRQVARDRDLLAGTGALAVLAVLAALTALTAMSTAVLPWRDEAAAPDKASARYLVPHYEPYVGPGGPHAAVPDGSGGSWAWTAFCTRATHTSTQA